MNRIGWALFAVGLVVMLHAGSAMARTLYVSDQLAVNLRNEPVSGSTAVKLLRTDASMELLGEEGDYFKVRLPDGTEGFFPKRYATEREPRTRVIARLEKKISGLEEELQAAQKRLGAASGELEVERQELAVQLESTQQELAEIQTRHAEVLNDRDATIEKYDQLVADAQNVVDIVAQRDQLQQQNRALASEIETLREENESLLISGVIKWFLAGGGVLFFGWLIGRASRRKRGGLSGY